MLRWIEATGRRPVQLPAVGRKTQRVISISEIVAPVQIDSDACEVWASAEADYQEASKKLKVELGAFLRRSKDNNRLAANWLPPDEKVTEHVELQDASPAAKEIFETWVHRVRRATEMRAESMPSPAGS
jgi:translation initiation factor IF-3